MPRERDPPYVAAGFREDAGNLIEQFIAKQTVGYSKFAEVWRELKFSTIFMGRETLRELTEFIEECFRNTLLFMDTSNAFQKVAAMYLLYSLYLKQPRVLLKSPIQIKISTRQLFELYELENYFVEGEVDKTVLDLSYIVTKLFKMEAFHVSCFPIPMGPVVPIPLLKQEPLRNSEFKEVLSSFSMFNDKEIKNLIELIKNFEELKKTLQCICRAAITPATLSRFTELKEIVCELEERYNAGLLPNKVDGDVKIEEEFKNLGRRRAMLKSQQYEKAAEVGMSRRVRASSDSSPSKSPPPPVKRGRGRPRKLRKKGRQKKIVELQVTNEAESEIHDDLQAQAEDVDNPDGTMVQVQAPRRGRRKFPRPIRKHYFEED